MTELIADRVRRKAEEEARQAAIDPHLVHNTGLVAAAAAEGALVMAFGIALVQVSPTRFEWVTFHHDNPRRRLELIGMIDVMSHGMKEETYRGIATPTQGQG